MIVHVRGLVDITLDSDIYKVTESYKEACMIAQAHAYYLGKRVMSVVPFILTSTNQSTITEHVNNSYYYGLLTAKANTAHVNFNLDDTEEHRIINEGEPHQIKIFCSIITVVGASDIPQFIGYKIVLAALL